MSEIPTEPVSKFAAHHPALAHGLLIGAEILLAIGVTQFFLRKLGVID